MRPRNPLGANFNHGDGDPDCPKCSGHGAIDIPPDLSVGRVTPARQTCTCVYRRDLRANLNRGWRGLWKAKPIAESPLVRFEAENLFVTARQHTLKKHVRHVALRMPTTWQFQVSSDADLISAWLSNMVQSGAEIHDPDVLLSDLPPMTLEQLVEPPHLLILILGVKVARNAAASEVLLETLQRRDFLDKPTWVIDQPNDPFEEGHIAWSDSVDGYLSEWGGMDLEEEGDK
jgi:hypothetical protein